MKCLSRAYFSRRCKCLKFPTQETAVVTCQAVSPGASAFMAKTLSKRWQCGLLLRNEPSNDWSVVKHFVQRWMLKLLELAGCILVIKS